MSLEKRSIIIFLCIVVAISGSFLVEAISVQPLEKFDGKEGYITAVEYDDLTGAVTKVTVNVPVPTQDDRVVVAEMDAEYISTRNPKVGDSVILVFSNVSFRLVRGGSRGRLLAFYAPPTTQPR